ncbi:3-oxoacyl-ACP reductase [Thermotoga sp. Ku-13t]|uniref:SDR family NAD(P)-dependent oxidoreductase n=1 Tax=Thermotoga sp. Ku-13t TaxID=1755813 RepID=UPI0013ED102E|nr:SDR family oxidoreductase [Thermotoga sp. Ku-13t]KAF2958148.1 3-oxoacyl-ACP reductase [Thermotoga sp. Ku-13t]
MKVVVVTGDSRGLGNEICKELLKRGYKVIGISRRASEKVVELMNAYGNLYDHINFDLSEPEKIKDLYINYLKPRGPIYGLVNNAAIAYDDLVTNAQIEPLETMFRVNVYSPILLTKYVIRDMLLHGTQGSIVHISSISAHTGYRGLSMYAATKGALEAFSRAVAREFGVKKIRSNCVAPGFMETDMSRSLTEEDKRRIYQRNSLREEIKIESVVKTVVFLISEESYSITGQVICVDNGTI